MKKLVPAVGLTVALLLSAFALASGESGVTIYRTALSAGAEVPKPKAPVGAGGLFTATVTENGGTRSIRWTLTFRKLSGKAVAAHIHRGKPGIAGGVLFPLCGPCTSGQTRRATIAKSVADALERGSAYVNVHTTKNAAGEIRGQVKLVKKTVSTTPPPQTEPPPDETAPDETTPYPGY
jgi:CHRD domain-containing protein